MNGFAGHLADHGRRHTTAGLDVDLNDLVADRVDQGDLLADTLVEGATDLVDQKCRPDRVQPISFSNLLIRAVARQKTVDDIGADDEDCDGEEDISNIPIFHRE